MVRVPVPSVPGGLVEVETASTTRRGARLVLLVAPVAEPGTESADSAEDVPPAVRALDGTPLPDYCLPAGVLRGKAGEVHGLRGGGKVPHWLLGVGADTADPKGWRTAGAAIARAVNSDLAARDDAGERASRTIQLRLSEDVDLECVSNFVLGICLGGYRFRVSGDDAPTSLRSVVLVTTRDIDAVVREAVELAAATALARDLSNTPSNVKTPEWLATTAKRIVDGVPGVLAEVRDVEWLTGNGFGGVLAVGGGSASPPRLIELGYRPRGAKTHLLLVGKGITFDTGGISIKPAEGMHLMRTDMAGGAAVIAAMRAIAKLKLKVRVTALVPAAENHVSGTAYRPGDVVKQFGGRTTQITNTDAEGRIVLADALAYGVRKFSPDAVVDVATLTGAMKVALGLRTGALFASDDDLADRLRAAGSGVGETWWRMPLLDAHAEAVESEIADVNQTPAGPGGITAALFLREFTGGLPWAHLDIAGPARADKVYEEVTPGGTGFAARTLVALASSYA